MHEHAGPNISKKLHVHRFFVFILFVLLSASHSYAQDMIGVVSALSGNASIIRNSEEIPAESGTPIFQDDVINSADNSRVQILLKDQTAINLGANASLTIDAFVYSDEAENVAVKVSKGAFKFISGKVATKNPEKVTVETPVATIGVRGTEFVGVINPQDSRIALLDGKIEVANDLGAQLVEVPGFGVSIDTAGVISPPVKFSQSELESLLNTVAIDKDEKEELDNNEANNEGLTEEEEDNSNTDDDESELSDEGQSNRSHRIAREINHLPRRSDQAKDSGQRIGPDDESDQ